MAENRTPRDLVSREKTARPVYVPPSTLPEPTPEPEPEAVADDTDLLRTKLDLAFKAL